MTGSCAGNDGGVRGMTGFRNGLAVAVVWRVASAPRRAPPAFSLRSSASPSLREGDGSLIHDFLKPGASSIAKRMSGVPPSALTIRVISLPMRAERVPPKVQPRGKSPTPMA